MVIRRRGYCQPPKQILSCIDKEGHVFSSNIRKGNTFISVITPYVYNPNAPWNANGRQEVGLSKGHQILAESDKYFSCSFS